MGRIRIILLAFVIAALMSIFASQGAFVYADQLVGVTKATNLIGKRVTNLEGKNLGEIKDLVIDWRSGGYEAILNMPSFPSAGFSVWVTSTSPFPGRSWC